MHVVQEKNPPTISDYIPFDLLTFDYSKFTSHKVLIDVAFLLLVFGKVFLPAVKENPSDGTTKKYSRTEAWFQC